MTELTSQFQNGICKVCGEDHRDVMRLRMLSSRPETVKVINSHSGLRSQYQKIYLDMFDTCIDSVLPEHLHAIDLQCALRAIEKCKTKWYRGSNYNRMITLNFKKGTNMHKPIDILLEKMQKISYLNSAKFVVENYTKEGQHPHIHMVIKSERKPKKSAIIKQFSTWLKIQPNFIDVRKCMSQGYVEGIKTDTKAEYLEKDTSWRNENDIKHIYF